MHTPRHPPPERLPTLVVLAAGLSTRFGAVKPLAEVGPHGEALIDYALFDAARSGFGGAVMVVREEIEADLARHVHALTSDVWPVHFVRQRLEDLPEGVSAVEGRTKPWGTGHAVWSVRHAVDGPFAVINADDFYGRPALEAVCRGLARPDRDDGLAVTYRLSDTLSATSRVSRATVRSDADGIIRQIREVLGVHRSANGIVGQTPGGTAITMAGDKAVSMGLWGLHPSIFPLLEGAFRTVLSGLPTGDSAGRLTEGDARAVADQTTEFFLSDALDGLIRSGQLTMRAVPSGVPSFGVTFPDDRPAVRARIARLVADKHYPSDLPRAFRAVAEPHGFSQTEP